MSQNGTGGGYGPKRPVNLAGLGVGSKGEKGLVGKWIHPKCMKVLEISGHFEKEPGSSQTQANIIPGKERHSLSCL